MAIRFHKMHGLGNDFVVLDARHEPIGMDPTRARALRPGTPVLSRAPGVVQVGLDGPKALVPDDVDVHRLLDALRRPSGAESDHTLSPTAARALAHLEDAGLLAPA